jgi:hypothetical protein
MGQITLSEGLMKAEWDLLLQLKSTNGIVYFIPDRAIGKYKPVKVFPLDDLPKLLLDHTKPIPPYRIMSRRERRAGV